MSQPALGTTTCPDCGDALFGVAVKGWDGALYSVCENLGCDLAVERPDHEDDPDRLSAMQRFVGLHNEARARRHANRAG